MQEVPLAAGSLEPEAGITHGLSIAHLATSSSAAQRRERRARAIGCGTRERDLWGLAAVQGRGGFFLPSETRGRVQAARARLDFELAPAQLAGSTAASARRVSRHLCGAACI